MRIKVTERITEIEATAEELRQSNSLADGFKNLLRHSFNPTMADFCCEDEDEEERSNE